MTSWEFPGSEPIDIVIDIPAGKVAVSAEPTDATMVSLESAKRGRDEELLDKVQVTFADGRLEIRQPKTIGLRMHHGLDLIVKAPPGSSCEVKTASADVTCLGDLARLEASTASGDVTAASVGGPLGVKTASGDIWLESADDAVDLNTASGDIHLKQAAGDISARTASGDVSIGVAQASVNAQTASGDVQIGSVRTGQVIARTVSGDLRVGVAEGAGVYLDLSSVTGGIRSALDETESDADVSLQVTCRTVSGAIRIVRATAE
jgi:DUF4097 and DUF4098 domain-containing protein YvlB